MKKNNYNYNNQTGMYRNRVTLRARTVVVDAYKQQIETFVDFGHVWSMIKTTKASEMIRAGQENNELHTRFIVKYSSKLDAFFNAQKTGFVIVYKDITYDVTEIINDNELCENFTIFAKGSATS